MTWLLAVARGEEERETEKGNCSYFVFPQEEEEEEEKEEIGWPPK